ncbi:methyltransferase domain-containing selenoprotein MduS [Desulfocurvibacter africanus]|uniref:Alkylhydroperoxidase like protein, AhpD family n=1 Tax=Desulfocurvibacter africanus subsp. africanus str. Walvis Bay TaxID=690850 RepID=F3YZW7_DESAF|nr:methyltransferase domain-containing selenoprotein MduS [Desulfocurvibacter africanus]EGJ50922.1 alkylhydroperoxidase like protein, AhpD family [Desulfocurvibacter africanus subsp. africanus str. Walvis Bay]
MFASDAVTDQQQNWDEVYGKNEEFFGEEPSGFGQEALGIFWQNGVKSVLELGPGQGRDTLFFAENGLEVVGLDYSQQSVAELSAKAQARALSARIKAQPHDVRQPIPFPDGSFDACYSHMLLCMHLSRQEIVFALREIHRVLRTGGLAVYSVRSIFDKHYGAGRHLGEQIYEISGFVVHFFSEEMIRRFARGFEIVQIGRMEEGSLPRDLFSVYLRKTGPIEGTDEENAMPDLSALFQSFFNATYGSGALDKKTKFLIALGASLAAGCDPCAQFALAGAKEAGASQDELDETAAVAMTIQATRIRNTLGRVTQAVVGPSEPSEPSGPSDSFGIAAAPLAEQPGRT